VNIQDGVADTQHAALTFASSHPAIATVASLTPYPNAYDRFPKGNAELCEDGAACYRPSELDEGQLFVKCHGVGAATIEISGELIVMERDKIAGRLGGARQRVPAHTSFEVTCKAKTGAQPRCEDPKTEALAYLGGDLLDEESALCANISTEVDSSPTVHSSNEVDPQPGAGDHTEVYGRLAAAITLADEDLTRAVTFSCGEHTRGYTVCADPTASPVAGDYAVLSTVLHAPPPIDGNDYLTYGFVFDVDGYFGNNFVPSPSFPNDWYQMTDRWYELSYDPGVGLSANATQAQPSAEDFPGSRARMILIDNVVTLLVPVAELDDALPAFRLTAFRHTGEFGFDGNWSGDVEPPVSVGLLDF
jgi:hypothetical protein